MIGEFERAEIESFWEWIAAHKDDVGIQFISEKKFWLYLALDHDILNDFTSEFQYLCEEGGFPCRIALNCIIIDVVELESGYEFTMRELWEHRPEGVEDTLGANVY